MSQARNKYQNNNPHGLHGRPDFTKHKKKFRFHQRPYDRFHYYNGYQPRWNTGHWRECFVPRQAPRKQPSRSPSPFSGTEEYTQRKIQETSDMIKKQLMMPPEADEIVNKEPPPEAPTQSEATQNDKMSSKSEKSVAKPKKVAHYNVEEIHNKIITHISKLSHGKKMNLICSTSSGYDIAIQQIQKQKRLELSKVLRDMCNSPAVENSEVINAIIPDIGIKIGDLPLEVIQELSSTLDLNFDDSSFWESGDDTQNVKSEVCENVTEKQMNMTEEVLNIKEEVLNIKEEVNQDQSEFDDSTLSIFNIKQEFISDNGSLDETKLFEVTEDPYNELQAPSTENKSQVFAAQPVWCESQTDFVEFHSIACQTDPNSCKFEVRENVENLEDAVKVMLEIDNEIARLTKLRQTIFTKLQAKNMLKNQVNKGKSSQKKSPANKLKNKLIKRSLKLKSEAAPKRKKKSNVQPQAMKVAIDCVYEDPNLQDPSTKQVTDCVYEKPLEFSVSSEKILVLKLIDDVLLAASESGRIFYINTQTGATEATLQVSQTPITCLCHIKTPSNESHLLVGSFEPWLRVYHYTTRLLITISNIFECVQCLEYAWMCIFIGTTNGSLKRYSPKQRLIEFEDRISEEAVLVLKATKEGARRVLLVGSRNAPVCVRDAMSGLRLRTLGDCVTPTVYSLLLENNMVYCGTMSHDILVFGFHNGFLVHKHEATNSKGICCMKVVKNLLYASCYNGKIYVYNVKSHKYVGMIEGPGGVILSMEVFKNMLIVGTMSHNFKSLLIPDYILENGKA
ncbi:hypothetical protein TcasGA2_TC010114 [Tribolium castaneum]|uniref:Uncharacterized protein n=1 Tax=Tribolium castaneum TaxID=7070 RepID=D6WSL6_TRICA|nr:hypothetical protein TcasGA2_TC010114 [Tribolium castaneum]